LVKLLHYELKDADLTIGCQRGDLSAAVVLIRPDMLDFDFVEPECLRRIDREASARPRSSRWCSV